MLNVVCEDIFHLQFSAFSVYDNKKYIALVAQQNTHSHTEDSHKESEFHCCMLYIS